MRPRVPGGGSRSPSPAPSGSEARRARAVAAATTRNDRATLEKTRYRADDPTRVRPRRQKVRHRLRDRSLRHPQVDVSSPSEGRAETSLGRLPRWRQGCADLYAKPASAPSAPWFRRVADRSAWQGGGRRFESVRGLCKSAGKWRFLDQTSLLRVERAVGMERFMELSARSGISARTQADDRRSSPSPRAPKPATPKSYGLRPRDSLSLARTVSRARS